VEGALAESRRLNEWIEAVLAARPSGRMLAAAGDAGGFGAGEAKARKRRSAPEQAATEARPSGRGRRSASAPRAGSARSA
jgi:hypothetical protein